MPDVHLYSIFTHSESNSPWSVAVPKEINPVWFGEGEKSDRQSRLLTQGHEYRKASRVISFIKQQRVDCVIVGGYNDAGRVRLIYWCRKSGVACFLFADSNIKGDHATGTKAIVKRIFLSRILRRCTGVLPCGSLGREYFLKYGVRPESITYFPYEPDYSLIANVPNSVYTDIQTKYCFSPERKRLVFSARLARVKRADLLIIAFARIADIRPEWDLVFMGDGPLRRDLERMVPESLKERVIWTGFLADQQYVSAMYKHSDVLVLPSDYEPWSLVINEATAAGLAIVASDVVGAAAELVREGVNGFTFPAGNADALTDALLRVTDPKNTPRMKTASREVLAGWRQRADPIINLRAVIHRI